VRLPGAGGVRLRYHFVVQLELGPGEYALSVGLSSTDETSYLAYRKDPDDVGGWPDGYEVVPERSERYRQAGMTEEQFEPHVRERCRVVFAETIAVGFDSSGRRGHAGLVDLPGSVHASVETPSRAGRSTETRALPPAIVHITHHKAGSQWIYQILRACVPERIVAPSARSGHFRYWPPEAGKVYPTVYLTKQQFDDVPSAGDCRTFVVVRDLRDALVSAYFSIATSHTTLDRRAVDLRSLLASRSEELGLLYLTEHWVSERARIQLSWLEAGARLIHYEDLLEHDVEILERVLIDECELGIPRERLRQAVVSKRFEKLGDGRPRGTEDRSAHLRKGVAGDWRNHFTDRMKDAFKARYGGLLVATGYEQSLDW
jgi:lipopolysaccharide transport system ATP-binding protein